MADPNAVPTRKKSRKKLEKIKQFESTFGNKFTFQRVAAADWADHMDQANETGSLKRSVLYANILEHIVVTPGGLKMEDFDEDPYNGYPEMEEVCGAAARFQQGK